MRHRKRKARQYRAGQDQDLTNSDLRKSLAQNLVPNPPVRDEGDDGGGA
jgi:hypothetical protein